MYAAASADELTNDVDTAGLGGYEAIATIVALGIPRETALRALSSYPRDVARAAAFAFELFTSPNPRSRRRRRI